MSEYTTRQILDMIEANGRPQGLDLSGEDLSGIDLSRETIQKELAKVREKDPEAELAWVCEWGGINLAGANLQEADLREANLRASYLAATNLWSVDLQKADLGLANLQEADLGLARLQGVFSVFANLQEASLWHADLQEADLRWVYLQHASLEGAILREADLTGANLQGANLHRAVLQGANLWDANLQEAGLEEADLQEASLVEAKLQGVSLLGVNLQGAFFYRAHLDHTEMDRSDLGPAIGEELAGRYDEARDAYLRLKQNFGDLGDYAASAWAYQKERQMEKATSAPWRARRFYGRAQLGDIWEYTWGDVEGDRKLQPRLPRWHSRVLWFYVRHTIKWLSDWFVEYLCGYGESIWRVLFWMVATLFGFATYYWRIGGVRLIEPNGEARVATSFWHYLIYSAGAFTTTQFAKLQAADDRVRMVTAIQAIVGIVLAGLLGFVAGNRIRRS